MKCLNCKDDLINHYVRTMEGEVSYFICRTCESMWMPRGELDTMAETDVSDVEMSSREPAEEVEEPLRNCPNCENTKMNKVYFLEFTDILLDYCRICEGFWLDVGELNEINEELRKILPTKSTGFSNFVNSIHVPYWQNRIWEMNIEGRRTEEETPPIKHGEKVGETDFLCPSCDEKLNQYEVYDITIESCPTCRGIWLDPDELRQLKDRVKQGNWTDLRWIDEEVEELNTASAMPSRRECPKCLNKELLTLQFGEDRILLDYCPDCEGTWLDRGMFQEIVDYLKDQLINLDSDEARERMYEEIKEVWDGPESTISEIMDAKASIVAFINITIFEHPKLVKFLNSTAEVFRNLGF